MSIKNKYDALLDSFYWQLGLHTESFLTPTTEVPVVYVDSGQLGSLIEWRREDDYLWVLISPEGRYSYEHFSAVLEEREANIGQLPDITSDFLKAFIALAEGKETHSAEEEHD